MELMKYRKLGRTGFEVSEISHGLWGMSGWTGSNDDESRKALQLSADLGCNFFDTAWAYGEGKSDCLLGELLRNNRGRKLYAASKIPPKNRSEEHTSELQSHLNLVCRLLLEKKKQPIFITNKLPKSRSMQTYRS